MIAEDARIRALRPPKPRVDPWTAHGSIVESERRPRGHIEQSLTVFLAGSECPFTCAFCDLWRYTTDEPTPRGALPRQLRDVLARADRPLPARLKLYNASNFFDVRAVPASDWPELASLASPFAAVTVESHASMVGPRVAELAEMLDGRLEVAIGLETVHSALSRLNKRADVERFDRAAEYLRAHDVDLRVFVLVGAPYIPRDAATEWIARTVRHAASVGASTISLIPVRGGNGELERLAATGDFTPPTLRDLEDVLDACVDVGMTAVAADLWDVERFARCGRCRGARVARLARINLAGASEPRVSCAHCDGA